MTVSLRAYATIAFIAALLLLGGASAAGFEANLGLQVAGAALIGWTLWEEGWSDGIPTGLKWVGIAFLAIALLQFLPLPSGLWTSLPGRDRIADGYELIDAPLPWLHLSLSPWNSLGSLAWLVPALAVFVSMRSSSAPPEKLLVYTIATIAVVSAALGAWQQISGMGYFYAITNDGKGVGFFANSNHQGNFLLSALALLAGVTLRPRYTTIRQPKWWKPVWPQMVAAAVLVVGVILSDSLACILLLLPMLLGLYYVSRPPKSFNWLVPVAIGLLLAAVSIWLITSGLASNDLLAKSGTPGISRQEFLATGILIARDFAPLGTGLGTFPLIYPWYESTDLIGPTYANHAHNDLLELIIETGILGLFVLGLFLWWYLRKTLSLWREDARPYLPLAASLMIALQMIHSLVDYPLRTAALSSMFALACIFLVRPVEQVVQRHRSSSRTAEGLIQI